MEATKKKQSDKHRRAQSEEPKKPKKGRSSLRNLVVKSCSLTERKRNLSAVSSAQKSQQEFVSDRPVDRSVEEAERKMIEAALANRGRRRTTTKLPMDRTANGEVAAAAKTKSSKENAVLQAALKAQNERELEFTDRGEPLPGSAEDSKLGYMGESCRAKLTTGRFAGTPCIIKMFHDAGLYKMPFDAIVQERLRERYMSLRHDNLAAVYDMKWGKRDPTKLPDSTESVDEKERMMVAYELVGDNMQSINRAQAEAMAQGKRLLDWNQKIGVLVQVANGCDYLNEQLKKKMLKIGSKYQGLGARQVMLIPGSNANQLIPRTVIDPDFERPIVPWIKMTDFVFGECLLPGRYDGMAKVGVALPYRWMAPESIRNGAFSSKSDVYSYGVVVYEVMNDGKRPFDKYEKPLHVANAIQDGEILEPEKIAYHPQLLKLYLSCLQSETMVCKRPSFEALSQRLRDIYWTLNPSAVTRIEDRAYNDPILSLDVDHDKKPKGVKINKDLTPSGVRRRAIFYQKPKPKANSSQKSKK